MAPIVDGRKTTDARIEVKLRVREPFEGAEMISEDMQWVSIKTGPNKQAQVENLPQMKIDVRALSIIKTEISHSDKRR